MIGFAVFAALLAALALRLLLGPLARVRPGQPTPPDAERAGNLRVLREQLAQIDADLAAGALDASQHAQARAEIERRVLEEEGPADAGAGDAASQGHARRTAWALGLVLPAFALAGYLWLGSPQAVHVAPQAGAGPAAAGHSPGAQEVDAMVQRLAERLAANPADGEGWAMLARSYAALERFTQAAEAYQKAVALLPADAALLADYADALAMAQGQSLAGEPTRLIERALALDARNLKALALAASAAMQRKDFQAAVGYWQKAMQQVAPDSEDARAIARGLAEAQAGVRAAQGGAGAVSMAKPQPGTVMGEVRIAPALAAKVRPGDTLFVYARAAEGGRVPLAILRRSAADLPLTFTLDDSHAMSPQSRLSQAGSVVVVARLSRAGQAAPASGDLQGETGPVVPGAAGFVVMIDKVLP